MVIQRRLPTVLAAKAVPTLYPGLWALVQKLLIAFPSSYLVKRGFSAVTNLLNMKINRLKIVKHFS